MSVMGRMRMRVVVALGFAAGAPPSDKALIEKIVERTGWAKPSKSGKLEFFTRYMQRVNDLPEKTFDEKFATNDMPRKTGAERRRSFYGSDAWRRLRYEALKIHGARCQCCGASAADGAVLHVDHIKPRSKYPHLELRLDNLQILCADCNQGKSAWDETDWRHDADRHMKDIMH